MPINRSKDKQCRLIAGWNTEFCDVPKNIIASVVLGGPFKENQLVKTTAFAKVEKVNKNENRNLVKTDYMGKVYYNIPINFESKKPIELKKGIPDPWAEYLLFKGLTKDFKVFSDEDLDNYKEHVDTTEGLFLKHGIVFTQGIPDPWKGWPRPSYIKKFKEPKEYIYDIPVSTNIQSPHQYDFKQKHISELMQQNQNRDSRHYDRYDSTTDSSSIFLTQEVYSDTPRSTSSSYNDNKIIVKKSKLKRKKYHFEGGDNLLTISNSEKETPPSEKNYRRKKKNLSTLMERNSSFAQAKFNMHHDYNAHYQVDDRNIIVPNCCNHSNKNLLEVPSDKQILFKIKNIKSIEGIKICIKKKNKGFY